MKVLLTGLLIASVVTGTAAVAKPKASKTSTQGVVHLRQALKVIGATAIGPPPVSHFKPKVDRDQGDDRANPGAILRVCSGNRPAAHRSAICPVSISPN